MDYFKIKQIAKKNEISLNKFYRESFISKKTIEDIKRTNHVPTYFKAMFLHFIEKELKNRDSSFKIKKENFFNRCRDLGYEIKNDKVIFPLFEKTSSIEIDDFESQFVKFVNR